MRNISWIIVRAVEHCNLACKNCNANSQVIKTKKEYQASEYFEGLDLMFENGFDLKYIVIVGGEPFLHKNLEKFICDLKERYKKIKIKIFTNGFWIKSLKTIKKHESIINNVEEIHLSIYKNFPHESFENIKYIANNFNVIITPTKTDKFVKMEFYKLIRIRIIDTSNP